MYEAILLESLCMRLLMMVSYDHDDNGILKRNATFKWVKPAQSCGLLLVNDYTYSVPAPKICFALFGFDCTFLSLPI